MRLGSILFLLLLSYFFNPIEPVVDQPLEEMSYQYPTHEGSTEELLDASIIEPEEFFQHT